MAEPCPSCGAERPAHAPRGLCPRCLLQAGLNSEALSLAGGGQVGATVDLSPHASVLETLAVSLGPVPRVLLADTDATNGPGPVVQPSSPEMPAPAERSARLQLLGEIAHGGMGAVLKGRDSDLGRDLAVKVLLERHKDDPDLVHRFVEEAQIAGQLQHPGVVPVYELGTFADRRPYFSMKLVKGRTLASLLAERTDPAHDLTRFVGIFGAVCQTVAYAHARGVIHRDLKPSNVMVGSFGEVQVMDWGLAKVLKQGGVADEPGPPGPAPQVSVIQTVRSGSDADASRAGSVLGTPAYMGPEQARGEIDAVDRRSDVFGLGSILCEVLTGQPAFTGRTAAEIQRKAARGDMTEATSRLDACGADPELVALARDCLASEPDDRPRDAAAVAGRLDAYLAGVQDRLRAAELERAAESARAEEATRRVAVERQRRRLTVALAASIFVLIAAGGGTAAWLLIRQQAHIARFEVALSEARRLRDLAADDMTFDPEKWKLAQAAAQSAVGLLDLAPAARSRAAALAEEIDQAAAQAATYRAILGATEEARAEGTDYDFTGKLEKLLRDCGYDLQSPASFARQIAAMPSPLRHLVIDSIDGYAFSIQGVTFYHDGSPDPSKTSARYIQLARAADPDPWRNHLRDAVEARDLEACRRLAREGRSERPGPTDWLLANDALRTMGDRAEGIAVLRRAHRVNPDDYWVNFRLGTQIANARPGGSRFADTFHLNDPSIREAEPFLMAAYALRPDLLSGIWIAESARRRGDFEEAAVRLSGLILHYENLTPRGRGRYSPMTLVDLRTDLAETLGCQGKREEMLAEYVRLIESPFLPTRPAWSLDSLPDQLQRPVRIARRMPELYGRVLASLRAEAASKIALARPLASLEAIWRPELCWDDLISEARAALERYSDNAGTHLILAEALLARGDGETAKNHLDRARSLPAHPFDTSWFPDHLKRAERVFASAPNLDAAIRGEFAPTDPADWQALARLAADRGLEEAMIRFDEQASGADPNASRFDAAVRALQAAHRAADADDRSARYRRLALSDLRADLDSIAQRCDSPDPKVRRGARDQLIGWLDSPELIEVRDPDFLPKLPEPLRQEWQALWDDIGRAIDRAESPAS